MDVQATASPLEETSKARPKVNNACEACRAAKVRCQPSVQSGICRRCLEFKRECVFRTGPRTRRPRQSRLNHDAPRLPPPPGPSKTFSINFDMPAPEDVSFDALESLASRHESYIEHLLPPDDLNHPHTPMFDDLMLDALNAFHHPGGIALTPPLSHHHHSPHSSSSHSHHGTGSASPASSPSVVSISNIGMKPQFNLDSASKLLEAFKGMLTHFPCILLPEEATVTSLAKSRPFVLLAILSVASGAGSLQGHTLYDDEFRKILGLKFVAGGERSVELLQGLLIYTAWYPFHLRPKNKQAFQYVRMAAEIANDLELVCPPDDEVITADTPVSTERIEGMRTYLSCYYLVSSFMVTWAKLAVIGVEYNKWTGTCCDVLERQFEVEGDRRLSALVRCIHIIEQTGKIDRNRNSEDPLQDEQEARFMIRGIEGQFREWKDNIPQHLIGRGSALHIATTFAELYLYASPLLRFGSPRPGSRATIKSPIDPEPARLARCLPLLRNLFDDICALPQTAFIPVTAIDWGKLIQITILALRLSLPLPACPSWDDATAREVLQFGAFLERFSRPDTEQDAQPRAPGSGINVLSASKIVFNVVRHKYEGRLAKLQTPDMPVVRGLRGCPMFDGSLDEYFPAWDPAITTPPSLTGNVGWSGHTGHSLEAGDGSSGTTSLTGDLSMVDGDQPVVNDMWSTMTQSWPNDETMDHSTGHVDGMSKCPVNHSR